MASEPVSLVAMYIGGFLVCVIVRFLYHLWKSTYRRVLDVGTHPEEFSLSNDGVSVAAEKDVPEEALDSIAEAARPEQMKKHEERTQCCPSDVIL